MHLVRWDERPSAAMRREGWRDFRSRVAGDTVEARWIRVAPSAFYDGGGPSVLVEARASGVWRALAWDHLPTVELRVERRRGDEADYHLRWSPAAVSPEMRVRLRVGAEWRCRDLASGADSSC